MPAELQINYAGVLGFLYAFARISSVCAFLPLAAYRATPEPGRIVLSFAFTVMLRSFWQSPIAGEITFGRIARGVVTEAAIGLAIGISLAVVLEIFQFAAQVTSLQAGLGYASTIDPTSGADSTVLLTVAQITAGVLFFVSGADQLLVRALAESLRLRPLESFSIQPHWSLAIAQSCGSIFRAGLRMATPVVTLLLLADVSMAALGRLQPQLHLIGMTMPVKLAGTMLILALCISVYPSFVDSMITTWAHLVHGIVGQANHG